VNKIEDVKPGMKLPGIVTNVTAFGAFVDIGVHQDGLVHVSQLADRFVKDPNEVVRVQQRVEVTVMEVDLARKRIGLSLKKNPTSNPPRHSGEQRASRPAHRPGRPAAAAATAGRRPAAAPPAAATEAGGRRVVLGGLKGRGEEMTAGSSPSTR
jgi:uncharacterized protein